MLDLDRIRQIAADVSLDLRCAVPTFQSIPRPVMLHRRAAFPPLQRPVQHTWSWWQHRGSIDITDRHRLLYAIARALRPWLIGAVGVGYGADVMAMAKGARDAGVMDVTVNGYDAEREHPGCLEWTRECFISERIAYNFSHSNLDQYVQSGLPLSNIDLFQLDAKHSNNLARDLQIIEAVLSGKGIVITTGFSFIPSISVLELKQLTQAAELVEDMWILSRDS